MSNVDFGRYKRIVQAFWDPEPRNDDTSGASIWCLGKEYTSRPLPSAVQDSPPKADQEAPALTDGEAGHQDSEGTWPSATNGAPGVEPEVDRGWPPDFLDDCESRAWFTYRSNFPPIKKSSDASMTLAVRLRSLGDQAGFTSDAGWGCMIRSGQSLLANALVMLQLGRDWRRGRRQDEERQLLSLFADDPSAPFSIHRFVEHGASACGKHPGEWFGPSATARCIQALSHEYESTGLKVYMNGDGADVYEDSFFKLAKANDGTFAPTLILVGIRLGIDRVTPAYWEALKASLQLPQSVGIAGGRPSSSHYFFGIQGDQFFYLDPHVTRPGLRFHSDPAELTEEEIDSCHTRRLRRLPLKDMDPSMLLAFLIKDEKDWKSWRRAVGDASGKPVVHVADTEPSLHGHGTERESAVDDVETFDDDEGDEGDGEMIERPHD
ncbi:Cysteine protease atg4 [Lepraria neglecta]|uniref:Cysteine protease n=1 Tax=Lepraria neglecta TaxID=209136 RepID=A0AAD9Z054_9LECA|nr:Cysteine protease atg4 [Lepraria neglecta]